MSRAEPPSGSPAHGGAGSHPESTTVSTSQARAVKDAFLANLRHELRTPLNAVIGYSEILIEDAEDLGKDLFLADINKIHTAGKQLLTIVNDVLNPARFGPGEVELNLESLRKDLASELQPALIVVLDNCKLLIGGAEESGEEGFTSDLEKIHSAALRFSMFVEEHAAFLNIGAGPGKLQAQPSEMASGLGAAPAAPPLPRAEDVGLAAEHGLLLVVDDNEMNRDILHRYLERQGHSVLEAEDGPQALQMVKEHSFDLILLDIMMPGMDGYAVCRLLKQDPRTRDIPVLFLSAMAELKDKTVGFQAGAVDYITKPFDIPEVKARVETHLCLTFARRALANQNAILERKVLERTREIYETQIEIITRLGLATEMRDTDTGMHVRRIRGYAEILAKRYGLSAEESELIGMAGTLHDIGKIGIRDHILLKPGRLDDDEMAIMKTHTTVGAQTLENSRARLIEIARLIALTHHERWDGKGYPRGLAGEEIPLAGRIVCLVDVFDALTTKRPYKDAWPVEKAIGALVEGRGSQFDPRLVDLFMECLPEIIEVREALSDEC